MSTTYGKTINSVGYSMYLDAGISNSYFGDGSIWFDLSSNHRNATLTNSPTYNSTGIKYFSTSSGAGSYFLIDTITFGNGNWTAMMWVRTNSGGGLISNNSGGPVANKMAIDSNKIAYWNYDGDWRLHYGNTSINNGAWKFLTWVNYNNNTMDMYVNGVSDITTFNSYTSNGGPCNSIGRDWGSSFTGDIAVVYLFLSKAYTSTETLDVFNATRYRFGV